MVNKACREAAGEDAGRDITAPPRQQQTARSTLLRGRSVLLSLHPCHHGHFVHGPIELALQWLGKRLNDICRAYNFVYLIIEHPICGGCPLVSIYMGRSLCPSRDIHLLTSSLPQILGHQSSNPVPFKSLIIQTNCRQSPLS